MYDLAVIATLAVVFALIFLLLYVLERVWCRPPTRSVLLFRWPCSATSSTPCFAGSAS